MNSHKAYQHIGNHHGSGGETSGITFNKMYGDPIYKNNGGGRDSYIYLNNGGFAQPHGPRA